MLFLHQQYQFFGSFKIVVCSIAEIVERYKKEQIVEGHVLCTPVVKVCADLTGFIVDYTVVLLPRPR